MLDINANETSSLPVEVEHDGRSGWRKEVTSYIENNKCVSERETYSFKWK